jgi:3D (Asp-Asp-Asp) domain-containing protein
VTGETKTQYWEAEFVITAYTHTGNLCATGVWPKVGSVAVDPVVVPLGSKLHIPGYGPGIAHDTGADIQGYRLDIFFDTYEEAINYGRKTKKVRIYL